MQVLTYYTPDQIQRMVKEIKLLGLEPVVAFADSEEYPLYTVAHLASLLCEIHRDLVFDTTYYEILEIVNRQILSTAGWASTNTILSGMSFLDTLRGLFKK